MSSKPSDLDAVRKRIDSMRADELRFSRITDDLPTTVDDENVWSKIMANRTVSDELKGTQPENASAPATDPPVTRTPMRKERFNQKQRVVLWLGGMAMLLLLLWPPFRSYYGASPYGYGGRVVEEHKLIFENLDSLRDINKARLATFVGLIVITSVGLLRLLRSRRDEGNRRCRSSESIEDDPEPPGA